MSSSTPYRVKEPLWLALMVVIGILISGKFFPENQNSLLIQTIDEETSNQIGRIEELVRFIENRYVEEIDDDTLLEKAIKSIFEDLDPHSSYISASQLAEVEEDMQGSYQGIGITTTFRDDSLYVQNIIQGSPAEEAGFMIGDRIIMINKTPISGAGKAYDSIKPHLKFEKNEEQEFLIDRAFQNVRIFLKAGDVENPSVDAAYTISPNTVYVKLSRFSDNVYREFMQEIESFGEGNQAFDLILDLRGNRGGYLPETVKILNQIFEDRDKLLVYTEDKTKKKIEYKSKGNRFYNIGKVAILIDKESASASEIIAGAIQDWDRGIVIGEKSFGKGLVQEQHPLSNGGAIRLTVARYYTPCGRCIQKPFKTDVVEQEIDTINHYSLELKRRLEGSGGITPDFVIEDVFTNQSETCYFGWYELEFLIAKYRWRYSDGISLNDKLSKAMKALDLEIEDSCKTLLQTRLNLLLLRNESGNLVMTKESNDLDPVVQKALSQLQREDYFSL
jgi:carboxyl-terminal processing protease